MEAQAQIDRREPMTAEEFFVWAESWSEGERHELVNGFPVRLQSERVSHAETKLAAVIALRESLRAAGLHDCPAFVDGVSVCVSDLTVREPDALVQCGPYDRNGLVAPNPVVVVEVVSPSSVRTDVDRKLIDYFSVPSIQHYLIVYGDEGRVVHHRRTGEAEIATTVLGREAAIDLSPPGFSVTVAALLDG